jgi:endonuclease
MAEAEDKPIRVMIREAVEALGGRARNAEIRRWVGEHYPGTQDGSVSAQIATHTVNAPARVNFPQNARPRRADDAQQDFLFKVDRGEVELYDPERHGLWELAEGEGGSVVVRPVEPDEGEAPEAPAASEPLAPLERLCGHLASNLGLIEAGLCLFVDDEGRRGVDYETPVGRVPVLAVDGQRRLVVIEVVADADPDVRLARLLRCRGWIRQHLAGGREVRSLLLVEQISQELRYLLAEVKNVDLYAYEVALTVRRTLV